MSEGGQNKTRREALSLQVLFTLLQVAGGGFEPPTFGL